MQAERICAALLVPTTNSYYHVKREKMVTVHCFDHFNSSLILAHCCCPAATIGQDDDLISQSTDSLSYMLMS